MSSSEAGHPSRDHELKVLVTAASQHGATAGIAQAIGETLANHGLAVTVTPPGNVTAVDSYDAVVLGSAVYMGHWLDQAKDLVNRCRDGLATRPVWLFSSGPVGDPGKKFTQSMWQDPVDVAGIRTATHARDHRIFAGMLSQKGLTAGQRAALLVFRGMRGDFRDWPQIRQWADGIARELVHDTSQPART